MALLIFMAKRRNRKVSKNIIASDLAAMLKEKNISDHAIDWLVSEAYSWFWSQDYESKGAKGKYYECPYWTYAAKEKWLEIQKTNKPLRGNNFIHEHVVPRKTLVSKLLKLRAGEHLFDLDKLAAEVKKLFSENCVACIVLKEEDDLLPREYPENSDFIWSRYKQVQTIKVGKIENANPQTWQVLV